MTFSRPLLAPLAIICGVVLALLTLPATALAGDSITYKSGDKVETLSNIQIDDVLIDKVTYFGAGSATAKSVAQNDIVSYTIDASARSNDFGKADDLMRRSDFINAITAYRKVLASNDAGRLEKLIANVKICECGMFLGGRDVEGGQGWDLVIKQGRAFLDTRDYNNSYYRMDVLEWIGTAYQARRQPDKAEQAYADLTRMDEARGAFQLARVLYDNGKYDQAMTKFKGAQDSAAKRGDNRTAERCELFAALSMLSLGKVDDAKDVFLRLTGDGGSDQGDVLGRAYLALGRIYGRGTQYEPAFMCVARAATVFKGSLNSRELQDAIGLSARAAQGLAEKDPAWNARAERLKKKYNAQYPRAELPQW
ncbi:MAG: tetratricopeptide repeat protein [Planctomycetota bacterium]